MRRSDELISVNMLLLDSKSMYDWFIDNDDSHLRFQATLMPVTIAVQSWWKVNVGYNSCLGNELSWKLENAIEALQETMHQVVLAQLHLVKGMMLINSDCNHLVHKIYREHSMHERLFKRNKISTLALSVDYPWVIFAHEDCPWVIFAHEDCPACPRSRPNPSKSDQVTTNKKKKKQKRKRAEKPIFAPILDLTGTLEIDIGLDKLKENKDQTSKVPTVDDQKDDADIGKQQQPSSSSSSSSEDTASSEPDTSEYSSEEMSSSKEEGEYTTVVSKKTRKLLLQQQKKASSSKKKKLPRGTRPPPLLLNPYDSVFLLER
ncbi:hypothetical protein F2Q70_00038925 [Brassica cretica]|uniref:Uncharacterized protein n=1 Tax=Brassica cretica TaxID=69181 RepID=A0A8S9K8S6_BRACR|nr:hypothetical protein F2Q70_00038925 [Brassica cretica]